MPVKSYFWAFWATIPGKISLIHLNALLILFFAFEFITSRYTLTSEHKGAGGTQSLVRTIGIFKTMEIIYYQIIILMFKKLNSGD